MKKKSNFFLSKIASWTHTEVFLSENRKKNNIFFGCTRAVGARRKMP